MLYEVITPEDTRPEVVHWVKKYQERFHQTPDALGSLAYDATNMLIDAIRKANSDDPGKIRDALASMKGFAGVTGTFTMDANGDPVKSAVILQIRRITSYNVCYTKLLRSAGSTLSWSRSPGSTGSRTRSA